METSEPQRLRSILKSAQDELAVLIAESPNLPFGPDAIRVEVVDKPNGWPSVASDPDYRDGAVVEVSLDVVQQIEAAVGAISQPREGGLKRASYLADDRLVAMALHWMLLHEVSHWALGHLHLGAERSGLKFEDVRLSCEVNEFSPKPQAGVRFVGGDTTLRCFELQADTTATFMLDMLHFEENEPEDWERGDAPTPEGLRIPIERRSALLAIGIVILLLQRSRGENTSFSHPLPEARAFAVMQTAVGQLLKPYGTIRDGNLFLTIGERLKISTVRDVFKDAFEVFQLDLTVVARALKTKEIFGRGEIVSVDFIEAADAQLTATLHDFMLHFLYPGSGAERFVTPGAAEFSALLVEHKQLQAELSRFARWG